MYPLSHFLLPFFLGEVLVEFGYLNHWTAILAGVVGVAIDLDHAVGAAYYRKKLNLKDLWHRAVVVHEHKETFIHRFFGFVVFSLATWALFFWYFVLYMVVSVGYYTHMFLDHINLNIFQFKKSYPLRLGSFSIHLPQHELWFDILLAVASLVLILL
ncbi:hypothetical protein HZB01_03690 [Candidatus Woesearchaeota archaeon]|nr:hypothetical protein [Candidatus Woesearchaeota archaeon]